MKVEIAFVCAASSGCFRVVRPKIGHTPPCYCEAMSWHFIIQASYYISDFVARIKQLIRINSLIPPSRELFSPSRTMICCRTLS